MSALALARDRFGRTLEVFYEGDPQGEDPPARVEPERAQATAQERAQHENEKEHPMCVKVTCDTCGKPTWSGCGEHIEVALAGVPQADRCNCEGSNN